MLKTFQLSKNTFFYFDIEKKVLARFPSNSNLIQKGSDNSLYFGIVTNKELCKIFCQIFDTKKIEEIKDLNFDMVCGHESVNVVVNINAQGQIQVKVCKDGTMGRLTEEYSFSNFAQIDFTKWLIVVDFKRKEIRFKNPNELTL